MQLRLFKRYKARIEKDPVFALFYENLLGEIKEYKKYLVIIQIVGFIGLGIGATIPFLLKNFTDSLLSGNTDMLLYVPPLLIILTMFMVAVRMLKRILTESVSLKITANQQKSVVSNYLRGPYLLSFSEGQSDKITHLIYDIQSFVSGIMIFFSNALYIPIMLVVYVGLLFFTEWRIAFVSLLVFPFLYSLIRYFSKHVKKSAKKMHEAYSGFYKYLHELFVGFELIKTVGTGGSEEKKLTEVLGNLYQSSVKNSIITASQSGVMRITNAVFLCVVSWVAFYLLGDADSGFEASDFVQFLAILILLFDELVKVGDVVQQVNRAIVSSQRLQGVLPRQRPKNGDRRLTVTSLNRGIRVSELAFSYKDYPVFQKFSAEILPGQFVAVIGESGVGKTTLTRLLSGLIKPDRGSIEIDGVPVHKISDESRQSLIAYAPQRPVIFSSSIYDNVRYGNGECSRSQAEKALEIACAKPFVEKLPQGISTIIGDGGQQLSAGQLQRVALARALAGEQPILLLDETFSNIDIDTEQRIYNGLRSNLADKTIVLVTHRLQTIKDADSVIKVEPSAAQFMDDR